MSTVLNLTTRISKLPDYLDQLLTAGLVPFIKSSPGMGKSDAVRQVAKAAKLKLIDHRMSTSAPEDMTGLPEFYTNAQGERRARFAPFDELFPLEKDPIPEGYNGWLVFLDEFNSADRRVMAAAYKVILDRMVGQHKLHQNVYIVLAGNLITDKAIVSPVGTALQSRVVHINLAVNKEDWISWAWDADIDPRIISFISEFGESRLMDFNPDHKDNTFCCPRTWEFMNRLVKGKTFTDEMIEQNKDLYAGVISSGVAFEFLQYTNIFSQLPSIESIVRNPHGTSVPTGSSHKYAITTMMIANVKPEYISSMLTYAGNLGITFEVLFTRSATKKCPSIVNNPDYDAACRKVAQMSR